MKISLLFFVSAICLSHSEFAFGEMTNSKITRNKNNESIRTTGGNSKICSENSGAFVLKNTTQFFRDVSDRIVNPQPGKKPDSCQSLIKSEKGKASFYGCFDHNNKKIANCGDGFHGKKGFCENTFLSSQMTVALPAGTVARPGQKPGKGQVACGSVVKLTNPENGKIVLARVMDTGGFAKYGRKIDVSAGVASKLGFVQKGHTELKIDYCGS